MAHLGKKSLSVEDISQARDDEVEKLIPDPSPKNEDDEDFFLRGPSSKKTVRFSTEKFKDVQVQIAEVTDVMRSNVGRLMERGEQLDDLNERSEGLSTTSDQFRVTSTRLQHQYWWQNLRANLWVVFIIILVTVVIINQNTMVRHLKYCQDPIQKHKKRITINLRKVTDVLVEKCAGRVKKDSLLCVNCWTLIMKNPTILSTTENNESEQDSNESSTISGLSNISSIQDLDNDSDCLIKENPSTSVEPVLAFLDQTPVKKMIIKYSS